MSKDVTSIAKEFVDSVLHHLSRNTGHWSDERLFEEDARHFLATVDAAGFCPKDLVKGKLTGNYREQDGSPTGETFSINNFCSYKVVGQDGEDDYFATGWLDCAIRRVVLGSVRQYETLNELIAAIALEVGRSVPLTPIQLTDEGDTLSEYSPRPAAFGLEYFVDHTRDSSRLNSCVGVHTHCNGWMDRHRATNVYDAIVCRSCHLRVLFPKEITTYGELRDSLAHGLKKPAAAQAAT